MLTLSDFIGQLRHNAALRSRFADDPRAVLLEHGIDPAPYDLPDRMSLAQMDRLLARVAPAPVRVEPQPPTPPPSPAPVYGPPPRPRSWLRKLLNK